nr:MAG TPA: hypothetical protein [Caudoviricetes sp.]
MSDGIHIPVGTAGEKPERTLRNLKESWEPLQAGTVVGGAGRSEGSERARRRGSTCTDPPSTVYVPPPPRRVAAS